MFLTCKPQEEKLDERKISSLTQRVFHFTDTSKKRDLDLSKFWRNNMQIFYLIKNLLFKKKSVKNVIEFAEPL